MISLNCFLRAPFGRSDERADIGVDGGCSFAKGGTDTRARTGDGRSGRPRGADRASDLA